MAKKVAEAGSDSLGEEFADLQAAVERLDQGLRLMLETQAAHTEMLRALMQAAASPAEPERALSDTLAQLCASLAGQNAALEAIGAAMRRLPSDVGAAVAEAARDGLKGI